MDSIVGGNGELTLLVLVQEVRTRDGVRVGSAVVVDTIGKVGSWLRGSERIEGEVRA